MEYNVGVSSIEPSAFKTCSTCILIEPAGYINAQSTVIPCYHYLNTALTIAMSWTSLSKGIRVFHGAAGPISGPGVLSLRGHPST